MNRLLYDAFDVTAMPRRVADPHVRARTPLFRLRCPTRVGYRPTTLLGRVGSHNARFVRTGGPLTLTRRLGRGVIGLVSMTMVATLLAVGSTLATQVPTAGATDTCPPQITSVTSFATQQTQIVTITGSCFGVGTATSGSGSYAYDGDSTYFAITDPYPAGTMTGGRRAPAMTRTGRTTSIAT